MIDNCEAIFDCWLASANLVNRINSGNNWAVLTNSAEHVYKVIGFFSFCRQSIISRLEKELAAARDSSRQSAESSREAWDHLQIAKKQYMTLRLDHDKLQREHGFVKDQLATTTEQLHRSQSLEKKYSDALHHEKDVSEALRFEVKKMEGRMIRQEREYSESLIRNSDPGGVVSDIEIKYLRRHS